MSISYVCGLTAVIYELAALGVLDHCRNETGKINGVAMRRHQQRINFVFWRRRLFLFFYFCFILFFKHDILAFANIYQHSRQVYNVWKDTSFMKAPQCVHKMYIQRDRRVHHRRMCMQALLYMKV